MNSPEAGAGRLDTEFDQMLADMKPHVLKLPHKSERQRCAQWIKKFCEPPAAGISGRKNRNAYSQLLLHMLKRGVLEGPFTQRPESGPLPTLPAYMSIYFDDLKVSSRSRSPKQQSVPDWVRGELGSEISGVSSLGLNPAASSTLRQPDSPYRGNPLSPTSRRTLAFDMGSPVASRLPDYKSDFRTDYKMDFKDGKDTLSNGGTTADWTKYNSTYTSGPSFRDDSMVRMQERELDMRGKMQEAKFQEEKLKMQQKHDATVQKILDRKNLEIEELKAHYRNKAKDLEETISKLDKKVGVLQRESAKAIDTKNDQLDELKKLAEHSTKSTQNDFEKKLHDAVADFEQEKFELQKQHTRNIQELLEDTNQRLARMEEEYAQQSKATSQVIEELEARVQQMTGEAEAMSQLRTRLEQEKAQLLTTVNQLQSSSRELQAKHDEIEKEHRRVTSDHEQELRTMANKHKATVEFLNKEHELVTVKSADTLSELEQHVAQLKQAVENSEQQRTRQLREAEQVHQQDKMHLEHLHESKIRTMQKELDQLEQSSQKAIHKLEQALRDKEEELRRAVEQQKNTVHQSEQALLEFKNQVERNSTKMYEDMKQQMEKVESDLSRSKQLREKQAREFQKQLDQERQHHDQQLSELKISFEQERAQTLRDFHTQKEALYTRAEQEVETAKVTATSKVKECEQRLKDKTEETTKQAGELERQIQELREQVVQANQLRRQQLVELGLLREEEKQKMQHDHEDELVRLRSETEQQRLEREKAHSSAMEEMLEKTNSRLTEIEKEYSARAERSSETINELHKTVQLLRDDIKNQQQQAEQRLTQTTKRLDEEKQRLKQQHSSTMMGLQQDIESQKTKVRQMERLVSEQEQCYEEKMTAMKTDFEERTRGLIPASVRQELENTISSLKSQVVSLQQRAQILQEEVEIRSAFSSTHHLGHSLGSTLGSNASIKSNV